MTEVMAVTPWRSNADLIADCFRLGYLQNEWLTLDCTYGKGNFWKKHRPAFLIGSDLFASKSKSLVTDFTALPFPDRSFDAVVFDPPYKLNGRPTVELDERYGVEEYTNWRSRMDLIYRGLDECSRVLGKGTLLLKCQDQVHAGKIRWQTVEFTKYAEHLGLGLVDRLDLLRPIRPQPEGRQQKHARRNTSTLLVFRRGWNTK